MVQGFSAPETQTAILAWLTARSSVAHRNGASASLAQLWTRAWKLSAHLILAHFAFTP